jgi:hypothetical protein
LRQTVSNPVDGEKATYNNKIGDALMMAYREDPDEHYKPGDVIMSLSGEAWAKLYLSQATVLELVKSKEIEMRRGTAEEAERLISLFDKYRPHKAVLVTPHLHD